MKELLSLSGVALGEKIKAGEVSVPEAAALALAEIGAKNDAVNAFITVTGERSLERAETLQKTAKSATDPLFGVPMALQDNFCTEGVLTTCGSGMLRRFIPPYSAALAERGEAAGALSLGKLNMGEFSIGDSYFGPVKDPRDPDGPPDGLCGGAAAAVAGGMCWYAIASDTGGEARKASVRYALTGMKPTYGSVSRYGLIACACSLDHAAVLARDARDCAAALDMIQGGDHRDTTARGGPYGGLLASLDGDLRGKKIGAPEGCFDGGAGAVLSAAQALSARGAVVERFRAPPMEDAVPAHFVIASAEASSSLSRYDGIKYGFRAEGYEDLTGLYRNTRGEGFGAAVKERILLGTYLLSEEGYDDYYRKAVWARGEIERALAACLRRFDLLLTPMVPDAAPGGAPTGPSGTRGAEAYTLAANLAGLPALSMPWGNSAQGAPAGIQLLGRPLGEGALLRAACALQREESFCAGRGEGRGPL